MKRIFCVVVAMCMLRCAAVFGQTNDLPRSTPEAEGIPSAVVSSFVDSLMSLPDTEIHSLMILRHGKVVAEMYPAPFRPEHRHTMYSCSKTFVSAAVGIAISENRLRLSDRVATFFVEELPDTISPNLAAMTVENLLTMTSGITPDWNMRNVCSNWVETFLAKECKLPGERFEYDSISTYLLSAIVQKVTGMTLLDYLRDRLFRHMNINEVAWEQSPEGYNTGGWGLHIQPESLTKFGLLLLNNGLWNGTQLISGEWVREMKAVKYEMENDDDYGYQMWHCQYPGAVRADGALGQYVLMIPDKDMVVVFTECTLINGRNQRGLVWNRLLPFISDSPLPDNEKDYRRMQKKLQTMSLPLPKGKSKVGNMPLPYGAELQLAENKFGWKTLSILPEKNKLTFCLTFSDGSHVHVPFGHKEWLYTQTDVCPPYSITPVDCFKGIDREFVLAGGYAWKNSNTLFAKLHFCNWISSLDVKIEFVGRTAVLTVKENYSHTPVVINAEVTQ